MTETAELYDQARRLLLAHPVPAFAEGVELAAAVGELARLGDELAELLAAAYPERPSAHDMAATHRRRAHLLTHLAAECPEYEPAARSAVEHWQRAETDVITEAVAPHR